MQNKTIKTNNNMIYNKRRRGRNFKNINNRQRYNRRNANYRNYNDEKYFKMFNFVPRTINQLRQEDRNIKRNIKNISNKINDIKTTGKVTKLNENKNKSKKEVRRDRIMTAMEMGLTSRFISIFPTTNRIAYQKIYSRFTINVFSNYDRHLVWFPYAINFTQYPDLSITVDVNGNAVAPNRISQLLQVNTSIQNPTQAVDYLTLESTPCGLPGLYRVVCSSLKIVNTTPIMNKGGSYIIYKLNENTLYPPFYNRQTVPTNTNSPNYFLRIENIVCQNHDQINIKQAYSATDTAYIHEFNLYEGNNIFQACTEYIGVDFINGTETLAEWSKNPIGNNIKYLIDFPHTTSTNNYIIESWQIIEVVPHPSLQMDNIAHIQNAVVNKNVLNKLKTYNPLRSKRL